MRKVLHLEAICWWGWRDGSVVGSAHVCRAGVGGLEIEVVVLAMVAQWWDAVVDEIGVGEHGQVVLHQGALNRSIWRIFEAYLVEVVDVILKIRPMSATIARHRKDTAGASSPVSVRVVDDENATDGQVDVVDIDGVDVRRR